MQPFVRILIYSSTVSGRSEVPNSDTEERRRPVLLSRLPFLLHCRKNNHCLLLLLPVLSLFEIHLQLFNYMLLFGNSGILQLCINITHPLILRYPWICLPHYYYASLPYSSSSTTSVALIASPATIAFIIIIAIICQVKVANHYQIPNWLLHLNSILRDNQIR